MRPRVLALAWLAAGFYLMSAAGPACGGDKLMFGILIRPACGKACKLVCEKKKLTVTCYGSDCKDICIPRPSEPGCKCCEERCCDCDCKDACPSCCKACEKCPPLCEFFWRAWHPCGCAKPRTVKVLTKYESTKEICWYHWEVVDTCGCCGGAGCCDGDPVNCGCPVVYKEAPAGAKTGDVLPLSDDDRVELASVLQDSAGDPAATPVKYQHTATTTAPTGNATAVRTRLASIVIHDDEPATAK